MHPAPHTRTIQPSLKGGIMRDRVRDERVSSPSTVLDGVGVRCDGEVPCNRNLWVGDTVPAVWPGYDNSSTFKFGET